MTSPAGPPRTFCYCTAVTLAGSGLGGKTSAKIALREEGKCQSWQLYLLILLLRKQKQLIFYWGTPLGLFPSNQREHRCAGFPSKSKYQEEIQG